MLFVPQNPLLYSKLSMEIKKDRELAKTVLSNSNGHSLPLPKVFGNERLDAGFHAARAEERQRGGPHGRQERGIKSCFRRLTGTRPAGGQAGVF